MIEDDVRQDDRYEYEERMARQRAERREDAASRLWERLAVAGHQPRYNAPRDWWVCLQCNLHWPTTLANNQEISRCSQPIQTPEFGGAVGSPAPTLTSVAPTMAWVLLRGDTPLRWYASEERANADLELVNGAQSESFYYHVHAVPRLE